MKSLKDLSNIRTIVAEIFSDLGAPAGIVREEASPAGESQQPGYRFQSGSVCAVWLPGRSVLVFFREGGELLKMIGVGKTAVEQAA
jgi:hypothetical protein